MEIHSLTIKGLLFLIFICLDSLSSAGKSGRFVVVKPTDVPDINEDGLRKDINYIFVISFFKISIIQIQKLKWKKYHCKLNRKRLLSSMRVYLKYNFWTLVSIIKWKWPTSYIRKKNIDREQYLINCIIIKVELFQMLLKQRNQWLLLKFVNSSCFFLN